MNTLALIAVALVAGQSPFHDLLDSADPNHPFKFDGTGVIVAGSLDDFKNRGKREMENSMLMDHLESIGKLAPNAIGKNNRATGYEKGKVYIFDGFFGTPVVKSVTSNSAVISLPNFHRGNYKVRGKNGSSEEYIVIIQKIDTKNLKAGKECVDLFRGRFQYVGEKVIAQPRTIDHLADRTPSYIPVFEVAKEKAKKAEGK